MKKIKCSNNTGSKNPSFFKILLASDFDQKLRIPITFIEHFDGKLPLKSTLRSPTGKSWDIKVKRIGKYVCFCDGWEAFVSGHSLQFGDFLVFKYYGESKFSVKIYGTTACEKKVNLKHDKEVKVPTKKKLKRENDTDDDEQEEEEEEEEDEEEDEEEEEEETYDDLNPKYRLHFVSRRRQVTMEEQRRTYELAVASVAAFRDKPHFIKVMVPSYVSHRFYLTIPFQIAQRYLPWKNEDIIFRLQDKEWPVKYYCYKYKSRAAIFGLGWTDFVLHNNLEVGDVCLFQRPVRKSSPCVLNVRIFRVVEEVVPLKKVTYGMIMKNRRSRR